MDEYIIREAKESDIPFLADVVIWAERGVSNKCVYSTMFNISEEEAKKKIRDIFEEEIDGCEFSLSSFLVAEYKNEPVAALGGWIECFEGALPSSILKSNLINYTFNKESIEYLMTKTHVVKDIIAKRDALALQLEYIYITRSHRGKGLAEKMIIEHEKNAKLKYPGVKKAQIQIFKNNFPSIKIAENLGYHLAKTYTANNDDILDFLACKEKNIYEKEY
jgi:hypothetical protein